VNARRVTHLLIVLIALAMLAVVLMALRM